MAMNRLAEQREARGLPVYHLEVGQPSTPAPRRVREAAAAAIARDTLGYTAAVGIAPLRERIAAHYADWYGVNVDPRRIVVTAGASGAFTLAFLAAFDPGDRVGVIEPGYPCYRNALLALGCEPVAIPVGPDTRWAPTPALVEAAGPLAGLVVASPSNPTGTVLAPAVLADLSALCRRRGMTLVSDEIYHGLSFGAPCRSALEFDADALVINSFSKYFSMTGWRLGWIVLPDGLVDAVERFQQNLFICAPAVSQVAALAAFDCHDELRGHVGEYARKRDVLLAGLAAAGLTRTADADGAFYVYADVSHLTHRIDTESSATGSAVEILRAASGAEKLCLTWLDDLGVTATPGVDFDLARGQRFVRFSYAGPAAAIAAACEALAHWTAGHA
jgi:aspartate/methionine/tyrosine aminotransferase